MFEFIASYRLLLNSSILVRLFCLSVQPTACVKQFDKPTEYSSSPLNWLPINHMGHLWGEKSNENIGNFKVGLKRWIQTFLWNFNKMYEIGKEFFYSWHTCLVANMAFYFCLKVISSISFAKRVLSLNVTSFNCIWVQNFNSKLFTTSRTTYLHV